MTIPRTAEQFNEVIALAQRTRQVRLDLDQFEADRTGLYPALTQDWEGGARDTFDQGWDITTGAETESSGQLLGFETELAQLWATGVEEHNEASYDNAIRQASGALQAEREEHNAAVEFLADADSLIGDLNPFGGGFVVDAPEDRVPRVHGDVSAPTEASNYSTGSSFLHYDRHGNNWQPVWRTYPDSSVAVGV